MKVKLLKKVRALLTCEYNPNNKFYFLYYKKGLNNEEYTTYPTIEGMFKAYRDNILYCARHINASNRKARNRIKPNIEIKHAQKHEL